VQKGVNRVNGVELTGKNRDSLAFAFPLPISSCQERESRRNSDRSVNRPLNLTCHEAAWQDVDTLQKPNGTEEHEEGTQDVQSDFHAGSLFVARRAAPPIAIVLICPECPDRSLATRDVQESMPAALSRLSRVSRPEKLNRGNQAVPTGMFHRFLRSATANVCGPVLPGSIAKESPQYLRILKEHPHKSPHSVAETGGFGVAYCL
jgi:hypothetical protein